VQLGTRKKPPSGGPEATFYNGRFFQNQAHMNSIKLDTIRPFSGPALTITSCNVEGINPNKE